MKLRFCGLVAIHQKPLAIKLDYYIYQLYCNLQRFDYDLNRNAANTQ